MQQPTSGTSAATYKLKEPHWFLQAKYKETHRPLIENYPIANSRHYYPNLI